MMRFVKEVRERLYLWIVMWPWFAASAFFWGCALLSESYEPHNAYLFYMSTALVLFVLAGVAAVNLGVFASALFAVFKKRKKEKTWGGLV